MKVFGPELYQLRRLAGLGLSGFLIAKNLRMVADDTWTSLRSGLGQAASNGRLVPNAAFALLWLLIFALCFS